MERQELIKPLNVAALAETIAKSITGHDTANALLVWKADDDVRVRVSVAIPATNAATTGGRRRSLRDAIRDKQRGSGWRETSPNRYRLSPAPVRKATEYRERIVCELLPPNSR